MNLNIEDYREIDNIRDTYYNIIYDGYYHLKFIYIGGAEMKENKYDNESFLKNIVKWNVPRKD
jgi:hypothetical protein